MGLRTDGCFILVVFALAASGGAGAASAESNADGGSQDVHPVLADPADLGPRRAEEIYQAIRDRMRESYTESGDPVFAEYQSWTRLTRFPYRASNHGERFANHYANDIAGNYRKYEEAGDLPVGSIVIKDSFVVTGNGQVMTGPLFMMEKMPKGFASAAGSWRFMMLAPDGGLVGLTGGKDEEAVRFCGACHVRAGQEQDFLFYPPGDARR